LKEAVSKRLRQEAARARRPFFYVSTSPRGDDPLLLSALPVRTSPADKQRLLVPIFTQEFPMIKVRMENTKTGEIELKEAEFSCQVEGTSFGLVEEREDGREIWYLVHIPTGAFIASYYFESRRKALYLVRALWNLMSAELRSVCETCTDANLQPVKDAGFESVVAVIALAADGETKDSPFGDLLRHIRQQVAKQQSSVPKSQPAASAVAG
jgi:hypothetical protein